MGWNNSNKNISFTPSKIQNRSSDNLSNFSSSDINGYLFNDQYDMSTVSNNSESLLVIQSEIVNVISNNSNTSNMINNSNNSTNIIVNKQRIKAKGKCMVCYVY